MTLFIDMLTDDNGDAYEYGHCYWDDDGNTEMGCGMEYVYYPDDERLEYWHDAVGLVTTREHFTSEDIVALEEYHASHMLY